MSPTEKPLLLLTRQSHSISRDWKLRQSEFDNFLTAFSCLVHIVHGQTTNLDLNNKTGASPRVQSLLGDFHSEPEVAICLGGAGGGKVPRFSMALTLMTRDFFGGHRPLTRVLSMKGGGV